MFHEPRSRDLIGGSKSAFFEGLSDLFFRHPTVEAVADPPGLFESYPRPAGDRASAAEECLLWLGQQAPRGPAVSCGQVNPARGFADRFGSDGLVAHFAGV